MEILMSIAAKIAEYTVTPIGRQVGYLVFYKDNIKELKDHVKELEAVKERIMHSVEAEKRNGREIEVDVQNWLGEVDEITEKVRQLCEDPRHANVGCSRLSFPDLRSRHQLSRNAKKITGNVAEVQEKGKFDRVGYLPPLEAVSFASATRGSEKLESRKKMKEDIVLALGDPKVSKIGVYGLGGVGKTTLVKEVAKQVKDDKLFDVVIMANVSQTPDLEKIQSEIADQLGLHFEEMSTVGRASRLCDRIKKERTILIILDDIWEKLDMEKLGTPSEYKHEGCKLLLTSRNQDVLQTMETQKDFRLEVLNEEETWSLFEVMAGDTINNDSLRNITTEVAKKCAGLPVLIVTMARALKNKDIYHWKDALNKLESVGSEEMNEIVYSALEFSYNRLEGDDIKALFLLCGILGTYYEVDYILKYAVGLGIFKHINTIEGARIRLYKMISDLKASCLLLDDDMNKTIRMHDVVCEVAISIASRDQYVFTLKRDSRLKDWPSEDFFKRCTQIILVNCGIQELPEKLDCPNLKLLHLNSEDNRSLEFPTSFFDGMGNLEVLDLTGLIISSLPSSLASLIKLQTLCLDRCVLGDMAHIAALKNLQVLSIRESSLTRFPSELAHLTRLKMLDLSDSGIEMMPSNIISKLTNLEELYVGGTSIKWEVEDSSMQNRNASLAELKHLTNLAALQIHIRDGWTLPRDLMFEKLERYIIAIGDIWESLDDPSEAYVFNSRLLMLKLRTSIHLEHGIKTLIKRVEDLFLDEINGISNVLYHLNGEGFPLLKYLHVQNNANLRYIIDSKERNRTHVFFPNLVMLILHNLNNLEKICHGPLTVNSFGKLRAIKVRSCSQLKYLFSVTMVKEFSDLLEIEVSQCNSLKNIVFIERMDSDITFDKIEFIPLSSLTLQDLPAIDQFCSDDFTSIAELNYKTFRTNIPPFFSMKVSFPNLKSLKLCSINLDKVWDNDQISVAYSLMNLANLTVEDCGGLKYLFSLFMVECLKNLKNLEISKCHMMEEIIATEGTNNQAALQEVRFSKLEKIIISDMRNLKVVWHYQFEGLKILEINKCERLENIFPSGYMQKAFGSLETLKVSDCPLVKEIFQLTDNGMHSEEVTAQLKNITLIGLSEMKEIWSRDPDGIVSFSKLQVVRLVRCRNLEYLFPFSIAKDVPQLEDLSVISCGIKEIVPNKDGPMEGTPIFEFNHLTSIEFVHLHKLKGFYTGPHTLECRSLKKLNVMNSKHLKLFHVQSNSCQESSPNQPYLSMLQPLFIVEEVIGNLEELTLIPVDANLILQHQVPWYLFYKLKLLRISKFEDDEAIFPHMFLQNIPNLERLVVELNSFKDIFCEETLIDEDARNQIRTRLKKLYLYNLPKLQYICREGCQIHPSLEVLETLFVVGCSSLRNLVPSSVSFYHLTYLGIKNCNGLVNLITSSTARSLVKLTTMKLKECNSIEEIVTEDVGDTKSEIAFSSLELLELECLTKLDSFSSSKCFLKFPLLEEVAVRQCPRMKIFSTQEMSTPMLQKVLIGDKDENWSWQGDLNGTINKMFFDKVAFCSCKHLKLSEYPELKELWYGPVGHKLFSNLKFLEVQKCDWLSNVLLPLNILLALSNLEELKVRDCDLLEVVFDLDGISERAMLIEETIKLKKITLSNLPKMKHIWKQNPQENVSSSNSRDDRAGECYGMKMLEAPGIENKGEKVSSGDSQRILSFCNLQVVIVEDCEDLKYLLPFSIAMDLQSLERLNVTSCGIKEIIKKKEGAMDKMATFVFNLLVSLELKSLDNVERFYAGNYILACQSLKKISVYNCTKLELFKAESMSVVMRSSMQQPVFIAEEVIPSLEQLTIMNAMGNMTFENAYLRVSEFIYKEVPFPNWLLQNVSNLEKMIVKKCSFEKIFEDERQSRSSTRLKYLTLDNLPQLQHICKERSLIDPLLEVLESITIYECSSMINLVPSSVSFNHLTSLEVAFCNGLVTLITSTTARTLVSLKTMMITDCNSLEQIVTEEGDVTNREVVFRSLEILKLECLPRLIRFSSSKCIFKFPSLEKIVVIQCPRMKDFSESETSTPQLQNVLVDVKDENLCWEVDLNATIKKMFLDKVAFCNFKHMELSKYPELKELWYGKVEPKFFCNLTSLVVQKCDFLSNVLLSLNILRALSNLEELDVRDCDSLEAVFDLDGVSEKGMLEETFHMQKITVSNLPKLKHIWKQSSQEIVSFGHSSDNHGGECQGFNVSVAPSIQEKREANEADIQQKQPLFLVEKLEISTCHLMEEIIATKGRKDEATLEEVGFCKLEKIVVSDMKNLKALWLYQFEGLKTLEVNKCVKLESVLPTHYIQKALGTLETLKVNDCPSVKEIFELTSIDGKQSDEEDTAQLKNLILVGLPKMKQIWSRDFHGIVRFSNLQSVRIEYCQNLEYLFPFFVAKDLPQLEYLKVIFCGIKEIVSKTDEPMEGIPIFELNHLVSLELKHLLNLKGFYAGAHCLECQSLKNLNVFNCKQLNLFNTQSKRCQDQSPPIDHLSILQPLFIFEQVIGNLEKLTLNCGDANMILRHQVPWDLFYKLNSLDINQFEDERASFPYLFIQNVPNLHWLVVQSSSFKEILDDETVRSKEEQNQFGTRLKWLTLLNLPELQHICKEGCQIQPILEVLEVLDVKLCSSLRNLVPSSVTFYHLKYLKIENCNSLVNLITSSTARSLVKLEMLELKGCNSIEEIVTEEEDDMEREIAFSSLKELELEYLIRLNSFSCSNCFLKFPSLEKVVVRQCPRMKIFSAKDPSTPKLRKLLIEERDEEWCWKGDLNGIINKMFQDKVAFQNIEHLELSTYPELKELWYGPVGHKQFSNLKSLVVQECDWLSNVLLSLNILQALSNLEELNVRDCDSLEAVFDLSGTSVRETMVKTIQLKKISLSNLPKLKRIWRQDFEEILSMNMPKTSRDDHSGDECRGLKMLEVQAVDIQGEQPLFLTEKVPFSKSEIKINHMQNMKAVWHCQFEGLKTLEVNKCEKLENIFPSDCMFESLETLVVSDCALVEEIFELDPNEMHSEAVAAQLKYLILLRLPKMKQIWSRDPHGIVHLFNLQVVKIEHCQNLNYLFPFSIAEDLQQLEYLKVISCGIKEIVSKKTGPIERTPIFELNHLTSLDLVYLCKLKGFYAGPHTLKCQSLERLNVFNCKQLKLFHAQSNGCQESSPTNQLHFSMLQPMFIVEEVIGNLEGLTLNYAHANMLLQHQVPWDLFCKLKDLRISMFEDDEATFPRPFLQNLPHLECLIIEWSSFKEIFYDETVTDKEGRNQFSTRLKKLYLYDLHELQHICREGHQIHSSVLEVLEILYVVQCSSLHNLVPSFVTFFHLTFLEIRNCNSLINLISSSTAKSLVKMETMKLEGCNSLEEIVEAVVDDTKSEITFCSLKILELECLTKLHSFSSSKCFLKFPLLEKVVVRQCPRMKMFSARETNTPMLRKVLIDENDKEWCWEGDLNSTIKKMFLNVEALRSFKHLKLSDYPELKELWYGQLCYKSFYNLKHLVVHQCDFLSDVLFSSNLLQVLHSLEVLEVSDCDSLEAVFDVKAINDKEMHLNKTSQLKRLTVSNLPSLKRIWNNEPQEILSFENLQVLRVDECQNLRHLFSVSLCQDLGHLEELNIESCGVEEIVEIEEESEEFRFDFPRLTILRLISLTKLKSFYPGRHTLECPSLKTLNVNVGESLEIFPFDHLDSQQTLKVGEVNQQAFFNVEKVSSKLEDLALRDKDARRILNGHYPASLFHNIKLLRLQCFQETPILYLSDFLKRCPNTKTLQVRFSSFETLFPSKRSDHCGTQSSIQIKKLWLYKLEQLKHIWNDDSMSDPFVQNLENLLIGNCSSLIRLAPPSISLKCLTTLKVKDCKGLIYLMTSSTAKSLVLLKMMKVANCEMIENVVMIDEEESEEEITFESLECLELASLSNFKGFYLGKQTFIFPSLEYFSVTACPKMQNFSSGGIISPVLTSVRVENERKRWKKDLNTTIKHIFMEKEAPHCDQS